MTNEQQESSGPDEVKTREEALAVIRDNLEQIRQQALVEGRRYQEKQNQTQVRSTINELK